jgi:hypothetical protein
MNNNQLGQSVIRNKDQIMQHVNRFCASAFHGFLKGEGGQRDPLVLEFNAQEYLAEDKDLDGCCYCALYCQ